MSGRGLVLLGGAHVHLPDHLDRIARAGFRITHVHDRDDARRARLCGDLGAAPLGGLADLAGLEVAGAVVCSETVHHEADVIAALDAGLPVFCEKPLGGSAGAAFRCADRAAGTGLLLQTGYFFRTNSGLIRLRAALADGMIGTPTSARMRFSHDGGYADWLDLDCWMSDPALACYDGFVDEAVHVLDALGWLVGPIADGCAMTGNALGWRVDDHGAAALRFESGAIGVAEAGWTDASMRLEIDIVGSEGRAVVRDGELAITTRGGDRPALTATLDALDAGAGIQPFLDAIDGRPATGLVPPDEAARVNALLDAMGLRLREGPAR